MRQRTVSLCRRNSEACSIIAAADINRSHISLNQLPLSRRQMSLTQSEPDSDKEAIGGGAYTHIHITHIHTHTHASSHKFINIYSHICHAAAHLHPPVLYTHTTINVVVYFPCLPSSTNPTNTCVLL